MNKEFNLSIELKKIFEKELLGKVTNAGRIYRKLKTRDEEFIKRLKEFVYKKFIKSPSKVRILEEIDKLAGKLIEDYSKPSLTELRGL